MSEMFMDLLMRLHYTAWMQLGKVMNPATGKTERNLEAAKEAIDLLGVLEEKTRGNLHAEEEKLLGRMLLDLRMNYVEEAKHDKGAQPAVEKAETAEAAETAGTPEKAEETGKAE
jgi:hypothetical protein